MKKQYTFALLLVLGFGIVTTMAFELNTPDTSIPDAYAVNADGTDAEISSIKIRPSKGGDRLMIKFQLGSLTDENDYNIGVELSDNEGTDGYYDFSSPDSVSPSANTNIDYANGYYETTHTATGASDSITIKLEKDGIWGAIDGVMITISDA